MAADQDKKKDLTGILEFAQKEPFTPPPGSEGEAAIEQQAIEQIDSFESLDQYAMSHPGETEHPEPAPEAPIETSDEGFDQVAPPEDDQQINPGIIEAQPADAVEDPFASNEVPQENEAGNWTPENPIASEFNAGDLNAGFESAAETTAPAEPNLSFDATPSIAASEDIAITQSSGEKTRTMEIPAPEPQLPAAPRSSTKTQPMDPPQSKTPKSNPALDKVKEYSERVSVGKPAVAASFPFSLLITGKLTAQEKEKLTDLLSRENMGIREVDLEPQFTGNRVLIPRISEYAGILIIQALRGTKAQMQLGPSDTIFATDDTRSPEDDILTGGNTQAQFFGENDLSAAENLPITTHTNLPGYASYTVIDAVTASAALKTIAVETESSSQYQETLEALQRELKHKAYRKGATAIVHYTVTLTSLSLPTLYRLTVVGTAIKKGGEATRDKTTRPGGLPTSSH